MSHDNPSNNVGLIPRDQAAVQALLLLRRLAVVAFAPLGEDGVAVFRGPCEVVLDQAVFVVSRQFGERHGVLGPGDHQTYDDIHAIDFPVRVMRARPRDPEGPMDFSSSVTFPDLWKHFKRGEDVSLPEMTHFIPMQDPALVARHILELG